MLATIARDFAANKGFTNTMIVLTYRMGHWVQGDVRAQPARLILWFAYRVADLTFVRILGGAEIAPHARIGTSFHLPHGGNGIVIHHDAVIGDRVRMLHQVTLGTNSVDREGCGAPTVGDDVYIGAGAKLIGPIFIGPGVRIGANAVVLCDVPAGATAVGVPARIIERGGDNPRDAWSGGSMTGRA